METDKESKDLNSIQDGRNYKEEYEHEKVKSAYLADRVAQLEDQVDDLEFKLNRIHSNPVWKASKPARDAMHWCQRQKERITNQGNLKGVFAKIDYKRREKLAEKGYGTASFPDEAERKRQSEEAAGLGRQILFSILVPLYNTPRKYLKDMCDSRELGAVPCGRLGHGSLLCGRNHP